MRASWVACFVLWSCAGFGAVERASSGGCDSDAEFESSILRSINEIRRINSLFPIERDVHLSVVARNRAVRMAGTRRLEHGLEGGPSVAVRDAGLRRQSVGENLARVPSVEVVQTVLDFWKSRHLESENIRGVNFLRGGAAVVAGGEGCYAVLLLTD